MKKVNLVLMLLSLASSGVKAQSDDMYFVPKKVVKRATPHIANDDRPAYYVGSDRDIDEYNRHSRLHSSYKMIEGNDSTANDIISFDATDGVYPDSIAADSLAVTVPQKSRAGRRDYDDDFTICRRMQMFDGFYDPWLYGYVGCYDPFYAPYWAAGWGPWGYYDPWLYGYSGFWGPWRYGWGGYCGYPYYSAYWGGWGWPGYWARPAVAVRGGHTGTLGYYDRSHYAGTTRRSDRDYRRGISNNGNTYGFRTYGNGRSYGGTDSQMTIGTRRSNTNAFGNNNGFQQSPSSSFGGSRGSFGGGGGSFGGGSRGGGAMGGGMRGGRR